MSKWFYPLKEATILPDELGQFAAVRRFHTHEGIDLYGDPEDPVFAVEDGIVVGIEWFTGEKAPVPSPHWNNTQALLVEGASGVVVYGEILNSEDFSIGDKVTRGQKLGELETVLTKDKGRPMTMLHLELYETGIRVTGEWDHGNPRPDGLLDPTEPLFNAFFENYKGDKDNAFYIPPKKY